MQKVRDFVAITKALSDPTRVRILAALQPGELCVCQVTELLKLAPSTISKHLSILQQAGLIQSRKKERWVHYRWVGSTAPTVTRQALNWVGQSLRSDKQIATDARRLQAILKMNPKVLCQRQLRS